uniref:Small HSP21-like protein n=1 Tax=Bursaphelenchus xylophilus TaxID=6326 RepID=D1MBS6_BURXY|nr:small HSP21-like protein [Bursaphelenchus xylophilus]
MSLLPYVLDPFNVAPVRRSYYGHDPFHELDRVMGTVLDTIQPALNEAGRLIPANVAGSSLTYSKEGDLTFACDTQGFKPDELKVDIQGQTLLVSGKHQEEKEGEKLERHFQRAIRLPKHVDLAQIKSELDEQGKLTVLVPKVVQPDPKPTSIPIQVKKAVEDKK